MTRFASILSLLLLSACGSNDVPTPAPFKELFSSWAMQTPNKGDIVDLTGASFAGSFSLKFTLIAGGECDCTLAISGSETKGTIDLLACTFKSGSASSDPGCAT